MRIVFMGTPDFAAEALEAVIAAGYEVAAVVTQPDRQKGRGKSIAMSPVKECALRHGIDVLQPVRLRQPEAIEELRAYPADLFIVAAFGQILPKEVLDMPRLGCVNIHASLLPAYRGAAPIQWAILDGLKETGVTIMKMDVGLDTGDILMSEKIVIADDDTGESLFNRLSRLGAQAIVKAIPLIEQGKLKPVKQDDSKSSYAKMLTKEMGEIDWNKDAVILERYVRGLNSWPGAYTYKDGKQLKIWKADVVEGQYKDPGTIIEADKKGLVVACKCGALRITELQLEGKKRMETSAFLLGYKMDPGDRLG
ncbi:MAG: methionyl-tRNA formyltransferase [Lachnospiraceae bacterium]|nr:methionyl-tRNA formyltransferase [Lachnospiraceae bacterium]